MRSQPVSTQTRKIYRLTRCQETAYKRMVRTPNLPCCLIHPVNKNNQKKWAWSSSMLRYPKSILVSFETPESETAQLESQSYTRATIHWIDSNPPLHSTSIWRLEGTKAQIELWQSLQLMRLAKKTLRLDWHHQIWRRKGQFLQICALISAFHEHFNWAIRSDV